MSSMQEIGLQRYHKELTKDVKSLVEKIPLCDGRGYTR